MMYSEPVNGEKPFIILESVDWAMLDKLSDHEIQHLFKACRGILENPAMKNTERMKIIEVNYCYLSREIEHRSKRIRL